MGLVSHIYGLALRLKAGTECLAYGRPIIQRWVVDHASESGAHPLKVLDIGCGKGEDLENLRRIFGERAVVQGIEPHEPDLRACREKGLDVIGLDIEKCALPYPDGLLNVVVINQVLEHTKEIFHIASEISRVLRPGGLVIVGLPNLATWHDRLLLLLGEQPSSAKVLGPHVRGITLPGFRAFIECEGYFRLLEHRGSGFYPFPGPVAEFLANAFPGLATSLFYKVERTSKPGTYSEVLTTHQFQTNYRSG